MLHQVEQGQVPAPKRPGAGRTGIAELLHCQASDSPVISRVLSLLATTQAPSCGRCQRRAQQSQRCRFGDFRRPESRDADAQIVHRPRFVVEALIPLAEDEEFYGGSRSCVGEIRESRVGAQVIALSV